MLAIIPAPNLILAICTRAWMLLGVVVATTFATASEPTASEPTASERAASDSDRMPSTISPQGFDARAVAEAIDRAPPGTTVQLAAGTYELDEPIRLKSKIRLIGAGREKTTLVYRGATPAVLVLVVGCEDVELAHMTLDGKGSPWLQQGISGGDSRRLWLHHLTIRNLANIRTWGPHAILFSGHNPTMQRGVTDSRITDCEIENIGVGAEFGGGIRLAWGCVRNQVVGNTIRTTGRGGIFGDHSAELVIRRNRVSGSGGEGLGIEIWGGCPRSLIEDNVVDHWISVDQGAQSAVRRNVIGTDDGTLKGYGIEIIARDIVVTDNIVNRGAHIGLSVSNTPVKNNVFWGYNTVRDCVQFGAQLQGETGGIARHYFYRCTFTGGVRGDSRARYPNDSGHGFRSNGDCRDLVFEDCVFDKNGGYGVQLGGPNVDRLTFLQCAITANGLAAVTGPSQCSALEFVACRSDGNRDDRLPEAKAFDTRAPTAAFRCPDTIYAGQTASFQCVSLAGANTIDERLWDFSDGIPEVTPVVDHVFEKAGQYRVTLIVWDSTGRGSRTERTIHVLPAASDN